jgi:AraC-type DNA-binding domain-containing proteins
MTQGNKNIDDIMMMMDVIKELKKNMGMNSYVSELFIYFAKSNVILTDSAKYTPEMYYETMYSNSGISYEDWMNILNERRFKEYSLLHRDSLTPEDNQTVKLIRSLRIGTGNQSQGTLVIAFKSSMIKDALDEMNVLGKSSVYIQNSHNEIITSSGEQEFMSIDTYKSKEEGNYYNNIKIHGKDVIVTSFPSKINDWIYVSAKPLDILMQKANSTRNVTFVIIVLGIFFEVTLALIFSRRNASPLRQLVCMMKDNIGISSNNSNSLNEIDYIKNTAMAVITETKTVRAAMEDQLPTIQASTMVQLLKGNIAENVNLEHVLDSIGIKFLNQDFCVMIIDIEACDDEALKKEWSLIKFIISNVLLELGNEKNSAYMLDLEWERMALLINVKQDNRSFENTAYDIAAKIRDLMYENYFTSISVGIGGIYTGIENIRESHRDAQKALEYKMFKGRRSIYMSKDLTMDLQSYEYSIETEMQLIKSVKYGDFATVRALLKEIFDQNFRGKSLSIEMARCFYFDIMSTGIKTLGSINIEYTELFGAGINPIDKLTSCNTISEMHETLEYIYQKICEYISSIQTEPNNEEIIKNVLEYIEKRFSDPNLSLAMVSDDFKMSPSYLSHIFKEYAGNNFVNWLRERRIEKIRELLTDSDMSLEQIAQITGYVNSNVLIRNFKKVENITPGLYREIKGKLKLIDQK